MNLGIEPVTLIAAGTAIAGALKKNKSRGAARPASPHLSPSPGNITVSPAIQTKISPMISPVFQQVQDSAGAALTAAPSFTDTSGQSAETGQPGRPSASRGFIPRSSFPRSLAPSSPFLPSYANSPTVMRQGFGGGMVQKVLPLLIIGGLGLAFLTKKRRRVIPGKAISL